MEGGEMENHRGWWMHLNACNTILFSFPLPTQGLMCVHQVLVYVPAVAAQTSSFNATHNGPLSNETYERGGRSNFI